MKPFTSGATNALEGRELIPRTFSRRQAIGLLGGSLAGVILLSTGLAVPAKAASGTGVMGPSGYTIPQLRVGMNGDWYKFTIEWRCVFNPSVVNRTFYTYWVLKEEDSYLPGQPAGGNDDFVSSTVEPNLHSAFSTKKHFVPSQIRPSNPQEISFRAANYWHVDDLDTELGDEELYAYVVLRENTAAGGFYGGTKSNVLSLSP